MLAADCTIGTTVRFKDGFSRYTDGKRFKVISAPTQDMTVADANRYVVDLERLDVKRPYKRLAYADCLERCD